MMFQKAFVDFSQEQGLLAYGDRVLIGLSGGPDSMALCDLLCRMRESWGLFLMAAHLNHSLRPSADAEAQAVAGYCRAQHIPLISAKINVAHLALEKGLGEEAAGRLARQDLYRESMDRYRLQILALGHHADDRAETILLNMIRGAGARGMAAMPARSHQIIRPLLFAHKEDILAYCAQANLLYAVDESNADLRYARNRIRKDVIPVLTEINTGAVDHINEMAEHLEEIRSAMAETVILPLLEAAGPILAGEISFPRELLRQQASYVQKEILTLLRQSLAADGGQFGEGQLKTYIDLLNSQQNDKIIDAGRFKVYIEKAHIVLADEWLRPKSFEPFRWQPEVGSCLDCPDWPGSLEVLSGNLPLPSLWTYRVQDGQNFYWRHRQPGDCIWRRGIGHQPLKKLFQTYGVPNRLRARWPILCDEDDQPLWLPGLAKSDLQKYGKNTVKKGIYIKASLDDETYRPKG